MKKKHINPNETYTAYLRVVMPATIRALFDTSNDMDMPNECIQYLNEHPDILGMQLTLECVDVFEHYGFNVTMSIRDTMNLPHGFKSLPIHEREAACRNAANAVISCKPVEAIYFGVSAASAAITKGATTYADIPEQISRSGLRMALSYGGNPVALSGYSQLVHECICTLYHGSNQVITLGDLVRCMYGYKRITNLSIECDTCLQTLKQLQGVIITLDDTEQASKWKYKGNQVGARYYGSLLNMDILELPNDLPNSRIRINSKPALLQYNEVYKQLQDIPIKYLQHGRMTFGQAGPTHKANAALNCYILRRIAQMKFHGNTCTIVKGYCTTTDTYATISVAAAAEAADYDLNANSMSTSRFTVQLTDMLQELQNGGEIMAYMPHKTCRGSIDKYYIQITQVVQGGEVE